MLFNVYFPYYVVLCRRFLYFVQKYLARAFMLMRRNVAAGIGSNNKGSIVERLCSDLDRKEPRYKSPTLLYFTFVYDFHDKINK